MTRHVSSVVILCNFCTEFVELESDVVDASLEAQLEELGWKLLEGEYDVCPYCVEERLHDKHGGFSL